jgi:Histidine kinase-like ATPase domain
MGSNTGSGPTRPLANDAGQRAGVPPVAAPPGLRWRRILPGEEPKLSELRRWLVTLLPECPSRDDVISVATELASNALQHTASGRGGWFGVEITWYPSVVRVAVADRGGPAEPQVIEDPDAERGRGLLLVRGLSVRTGVVGDQRGRLVWADIAWTGPAEAVAAASLDLFEAAIREGQAVLGHRFAGVPAWFGRSTLAWWALTRSGGLVTAPTARELAGLLYRLLDAPSSWSRASERAQQDVHPGRERDTAAAQHHPARELRCGPGPRAGGLPGHHDPGRTRRGPGESRGRAQVAAARPRRGIVLAL